MDEWPSTTLVQFTMAALDCALDLMRRMPPAKVEENLVDLIRLIPEYTDELLSTIDQPLLVHKCKQTGKEFLSCDYNRDGDSYRFLCLTLDLLGPMSTFQTLRMVFARVKN